VRLSNVAHLYSVRIRSRLVQELLALAGITVGVALVFAALVANTSLTGSVKQLTDGLVGQATIQLVGRGADGFDEDLLARVRRIEGVADAAPIFEARANIIGPRGRRSVQLFGGDPRFARLGGALLDLFAARDRQQASELGEQEGIALPAPMATALGITPSRSFRVEIDTQTVRVPLALPLPREDIGQLVESPVAIAPLAYAQKIARMEGRINRIFVKPEAGQEAAVEASLRHLANDRVNVRPADSDIAIFEQAAYPTNQSTTLFSVFSALVGFLFAFSAVLLTVPQRRNLIADLRIAGHDTKALIQVLLFDALVLGVLGALLGLVLGDQISRHLFGSVPGYLAFAFPLGEQRIVTWETVAISGGAGIAAACVAVLVPLRDVAFHHPLASPSPDRTIRRETWAVGVGLICLITTTAIIAAAPAAALIGVIALTIALLCLLPLLLRLAIWGFEAVSRNLKSSVPTLAILELRSRAAHTRTLALAATGGIAVFATVAIGGAHADLQRGLDESAREIDGNADVWATFRGTPNAFATTAFAEQSARTEALRDLPGVGNVQSYRGGFLDIGDRRAWVVAPPRTAVYPIPPSQIRSASADTAEDRVAAGGWVALSEAIAKEFNVGVGDPVKLPSPVPTTFRVAAVTTNLGWPPGAIVLNADDYARAWGSTATSALHIQAAPGASVERLTRAVKSTLGPRVPLLVETKAERISRHYAASRQGLDRLTQISVLVVISAILAMAAVMAGMLWQRRPTVAALKVHGYSERELWRALMLESGLLLGTGCVVGAVFGLYGQLLLSRALETITGFPVFYSAAALVAGSILALVTLVAVAMLALPGWLAVRVRATPGVPG